MEKKFANIHSACGEICSAKTSNSRFGFNFKPLKTSKLPNCDSLFAEAEIDAPLPLPFPPKKLPAFAKAAFSYEGQIPIEYLYMKDNDNAFESLKWSNKQIEVIIKDVKAGKFHHSSYGPKAAEDIYKAAKDKLEVEGKHVLVIGSRWPWIEGILLAAGASHVTTLEYSRIEVAHPNITTSLPSEVDRGQTYDAVVTFSSLEHSGLGRYGDGLNPWGDVIAMAKVHCLLKPGGVALVGVPAGEDKILFNACRVYGPNLLSRLFANFELLWTDAKEKNYDEKHPYSYQPLFVVKKPE